MSLTLREAVARFGAEAKTKLANVAAVGEPEEQLRAPLERLIGDLAEMCAVPRDDVAAVGESRLAELHTRPDYAITVGNALTGFIEVKAPGKGADPRRFRNRHDRRQWEKLRSLPNLIYTDGNEFSLWHDGQLEGAIVRLAHRRYRDLWSRPRRAPEPPQPFRRLSPVAAFGPARRQTTGRRERAAVPAAARRGGRADGTG